jgi:hypothetical protein
VAREANVGEDEQTAAFETIERLWEQQWQAATKTAKDRVYWYFLPARTPQNPSPTQRYVGHQNVASAVGHSAAAVCERTVFFICAQFLACPVQFDGSDRTVLFLPMIQKDA